MKPRIFLSAVTRELHSARQLGANILTRLGYEPVWQDIFGTEAGDLRQMLRDKIDSCDGLIHLVGFGYGAEPAQPDAEFGRVSYTQYEYCYARRTGKKTWILFVQDGFPADLPPDQLDLPPAGHPDPAAYQTERRGLQDAWRARLRGEGQLRHAASTTADFELKFERLKDELQSLRRSFRAWQRVVVGLLLLLLVGGGILYATVIRHREQMHMVGEDVKDVHKSVGELKHSIEEQLAKIRPDDIRRQLRDTIEETYKKDLVEAENLSDWKKRAEAKKDAFDTRIKRLDQVEEFLDSITSSIKSGEATPELLEFARILQDQGPVEAVKYIDSQEQQLLSEAEKLTRQKRRKLLPILEAARVHFNRGELTQARDKSEKLLGRDGDWPEALYQHMVVMEVLGNRALIYNTIENAHASFQAMAKSARRRWELDSKDALKQRHLLISLNEVGDVYVRLGHSDEALQLYQDGLKISRQLVRDDPKDTQKQRDLLISFHKLGDVYVNLGRADDALKHYEDGLKITRQLAQDDPNNAQKQGDLSFSLGRLGDMYVRLGHTHKALKHYEDGLKISRQLA
jgi:tetratricopeptide (TPR) repeat protein